MVAVWRDEMSVGNLAIDEQHIYWYGLLNVLELALLHDRDPSLTRIMLARLYEYTDEHFTEEERIQELTHCVEREEHAAEHQRMREELREALDRIAGLVPGSGSIPSEGEDHHLIREELQHIRKWMIAHVQGSDSKMKDQLQKYPPDFR